MTETVQLFITCLVDSFFPHIGEAMVKVLNRAGVRVEFPSAQTCCGQPAFNAGLRSTAIPMAKHTIQVFEKTSGDIIIPSGSCTAMVRHGYLELFKNDSAWLERAHALSLRVYEFTEYLVDVCGITDLSSRWPGKLTYHPSCHLLRSLGVDRQPRALLAQVKDAEIIELPEREDCCGFGGVFSVEHPELSAEFLKRKIANLEKTGSPTLVVADTGCLMHIQGGLVRQGKNQRVVHIAEVLGNIMSLKSFRLRIRQSIADDNLQLALDNNAARRRDGRVAAFASLPDHQERRLRAHAVKADVIAHLDQYLDQFISRVTANGIQVHRAADAKKPSVSLWKSPFRCTDRRRISRDESKPLLVAKSKSMLSEEIDFNHALAASGIRAVETDLGEYIVQLRGERPSHIITPAVHLRRADVGRLFADKLGIPYTEDIPVLTDTARKVLREVFLTADIGISGVNFGVVETGTLALVTNEGNGRMCTTLPPVHVALMGIERLVPTLDDLALFLSLLARSATGQKLSVYTSLINSPLPGQARHLILLDNGRSSLQASPLAESLFCIRCGACLNACPVFREAGGHAYGSIYPGPIGSVISCALVDPQLAYLAQASSLCGACKEACPVDIDLPGMLLRVRSGQTPHNMINEPEEGEGIPPMVKFGLVGYRVAAGTSGLFTFFQRLGGLASRIFSPRRAYMRLPAWTGWGFSKDFPRLALRPFRSGWEKIEQKVEDSPATGPGKTKNVRNLGLLPRR